LLIKASTPSHRSDLAFATITKSQVNSSPHHVV
jgi:ribulose-5-phosphate 4-epimerase/fuculose-1-phosphate aldolase